ncbi:hypothetical protein P5G62_010205 [Neobacillus sp. 179-C4.2 HS]|uniref:DUF1878 family protein n=1 Tax=Neobacillus driksii TaxID=3035913 RepID=A0ABV4YRK2_9BACI|nr:hypothetical protein [Neobacillus sp. 179.-C4.2 HS]MDP5195054.1 hypothetical protein [Neobacillus sp. 179.-C4.2 HS]
MESYIEKLMQSIDVKFYTSNGKNGFQIANRESLYPIFDKINKSFNEKEFLTEDYLLEIAVDCFGADPSAVIDTLALLKKYTFYGNLEFKIFYLKDIVALEELIKIIDVAKHEWENEKKLFKTKQ